MIVRTFEGLQSLTPTSPSWADSSGSVNLYGLNSTYAELYATQPNIRICVDFLARNIAELSPQVFRRVSDTDRKRLVDHELARWLGKPNPSTRRYRLFETLIGDMGVYFNAYWLKVRYVDGFGRNAIGLVALPPEELKVAGGILPTHFQWTAANGRVKTIERSEIVYFNGYNPRNRLMGLSPLETLRNILAEEHAASSNRESFWRNAGRMEGIIERPATAKSWTKEQKDSWREQWQQFSAGGARVGQVAVLEDGMTARPWSFSSRDSEYTVGGKLRREVCAAAYHIPLPMVGILEHATFSNVKEQHKHLYQDCLGPWLEMIVQELEGQLLIECDDQEGVYTEFNIGAKLAGSFEEQAQSLQLAVGKPWMYANEARALRNLPRDDDPASDRLAPQQGGPAAPPTPAPADDDPPTPAREDLEPDDDSPANAIIAATRTRQQARLNKLPLPERAAAFFADFDRWNRELAHDLAPLVGAEDATRLALEANANTFLALDTEAA